MIGDLCSLRFTPDSNGTPKPFRSDSGTYHVRRTVAEKVSQKESDVTRDVTKR